MYAEERQQAIADLLTQRGRLSVTELADRFTVTTETVRRDLSTLERAGIVRRVHGGAIPAASLSVLEVAVNERDLAQGDQKDRVAMGTALVNTVKLTSRGSSPAGSAAPPRPRSARRPSRPSTGCAPTSRSTAPTGSAWPTG